MKKTYFYSILLSFSLMAGSCSDFLDRDPDRILSDEQVFSDPKLIVSVLANFYGRLEWGQRITDAGSYICLDETLRSSGGPDLFRTFNDDHWRIYDYGLIRNINQFLKSIDNTTVIPESEKRQLKSEARFIRAYTYFCMGRCMGGMPIVGDQIFEYTPGMDITQLQVARSTEAGIYDYIISECTEISGEGMLSAEPSKFSARATKWAALALKARAAIYAGSIANYNNKLPNPVQTPGLEVGIPAEKAAGYYQLAFDTAKELIEGGVYRLQDNNADKVRNFYEATSLKENNTEVIWARDYKGPSNYQGWSRSNVAPTHAEDIDQSYLGPVLNLVEDFEYVNNRDGKLKLKQPNGEYIFYDNASDLFKDKDPRLFATVIVPGGKFRGTEVVLRAGVKVQSDNAWKTVTGQPGIDVTSRGLVITSKNGPVISGDAEFINKSGFFVMKFMDETIGATTRGKGSEIWFPRFRMSEIYLIAAEAAYELQDQANASLYLNAVRKRAGIQELTDPVTLDDIIRENRVEFAFENHRFYDVKRWRIADKIWDNNENTPTAIHRVLYPYMIEQPNGPNDGKWVFDSGTTYMSPYPRYFQMKNYYNFIHQDWLNKNPKMVKNPYQS
ncbi:MAG: RagB/SusD family nutrient uptake outer membrane protein [Bacteroidales bacterium]